MSIIFKICRIFNEQIRVRNRFQGKPAFFLNTFPKARPLKVCILLCIPVRDIYPEQWSVQGRNNSLSAQHSSNPPQEKRSCDVRTRHDSRIREILSSPRDEKNFNHTQLSNSWFTISRSTGNIRFLLAWECIPECMPRSISRNSGKTLRRLFLLLNILNRFSHDPLLYRYEVQRKGFISEKIEKDATCISRFSSYIRISIRFGIFIRQRFFLEKKKKRTFRMQSSKW